MAPSTSDHNETVLRALKRAGAQPHRASQVVAEGELERGRIGCEVARLCPEPIGPDPGMALGSDVLKQTLYERCGVERMA